MRITGCSGEDWANKWKGMAVRHFPAISDGQSVLPEGDR